ncbi:3D domain-containing protein [Sporosarcina luteola]|uniref:3D domain-containing protein n=1 Tax=Sporosarcina luteola TaxID=582850 RepID=UPI00204158FC|nr:3D domain-containing protein [Sporosarcina luteola]MCM3745539.1 3D domain-containing protein [Sporosarcina luteola]
MKMMMLTAIMTLSFSAVTEAALFSQTESEEEITNLSKEEVSPNLIDIPFAEIWEGTFPLFYPPLDLLKEEPVTYTVVGGDNLYRIALNFEMTVQELMSLNNLTGEVIHPGDVLLIKGDHPGNETAALEAVKVASATQESIPENAKKKPAFNTSVSNPPASSGTEMFVTATAYTAYCPGCSGTTAYGIDLRANPDQKVIAVDPSIIPLGTKVWVEGYGEAIAGDVGSAIKGHKIDVFIPSYDSAMQWGVKKVKLKIIN